MTAISRVLLLGGLEPSGCAGLLVDVQVARALRTLPLAVATALTAQGPQTFLCQPVSPAVIHTQLRALSETDPVGAAKLGVVPNSRILGAIRRHLRRIRVPLVVDPVIRSSHGDRLSSLTARHYLTLASDQVVLTPNLDELGWLAGGRKPRRPEECAELAKQLTNRGFLAVVVKGGHAEGPPVDVLCTRTQLRFFASGARLPRTAGHRGTGCRFGTALAASLAQGHTLEQGVLIARRLVRKFLQGSIIGGS